VGWGGEGAVDVVSEQGEKQSRPSEEGKGREQIDREKQAFTEKRHKSKNTRRHPAQGWLSIVWKEKAGDGRKRAEKKGKGKKKEPIKPLEGESPQPHPTLPDREGKKKDAATLR